MNTVGVHTAQRAGIHRHARRRPFSADGRNGPVLPDAIGTQRHGEIFSVNAGIDFRCACHNRHRIGLAAVQPLALNGNGAFTDFQRGQIATGIELRFTGGQRDVRRVDKSTAVTGNAIGVCDHDVRRPAGNFRVPL